MNIQKAIEVIEQTFKVNTMKDKYGSYKTPPEQQRPLILIGPPGVGKTAAVEQAAEHLGVPMLSYSMTHHTRQSAIGLPIIEHKTYGDQEFTVTEYSMSDIIRDIYEAIERSGQKEGILFLDEINCVSETLTPILLQFLQYKVLGGHRIPEGWTVVTAGNPLEFNNSAHEFDVVTMDRLQLINVEQDYNAWKVYASNKGLNPGILSFLDTYQSNGYFYKMETTVDGKRFATPRGWTDLAKKISDYEENGFEVTRDLVQSFIQDESIALAFMQYYKLYKRYHEDFDVSAILKGKTTSKARSKAVEARENKDFGVGYALIEILTDALRSKTADVFILQNRNQDIFEFFMNARQLSHAAPENLLNKEIEKTSSNLRVKSQDHSLSENDKIRMQEYISALQELLEIDYQHKNSLPPEMLAVLSPKPAKKVRKTAKKANPVPPAETDPVNKEPDRPLTMEETCLIWNDLYEKSLKKAENFIKETKNCYSNVFDFLHDCYGTGEFMRLFCNEIFHNDIMINFVSTNNVKEYFTYSKDLQTHDTSIVINQALSELNLDMDAPADFAA